MPVVGEQRPTTSGLGRLGEWWRRHPWVPLLAVVLLVALWRVAPVAEPLPYSSFEQYLREGRIDEVTIGDREIVGRLKTPGVNGATRVVAPLVDPALAARLSQFDVTYTRSPSSPLLEVLASWLLPALLLMGLWSFAARRLAGGGAAGGLGGGLLGIGRSRARVYAETHVGVRFADVAGVDEAKAELQEIVDFLKNPQEHGRLGARIPKGVLLMGPTGTGKTLLARAVAGEAGVAFFSISGSEFIEMFVGVGAARVRDLFEQAWAQAPAIIFIDELDALGKARGAFAGGGGHDEREQTLNQLLVELDGFDPRVGVVLLAATNRPEILDPALLRAGRFDRQVLVDRPDRRGRREILQVHVKKVHLAADVDLDQVAAITVGLAGADLANVVNEAALHATRRDADAVGQADFTQAVERIVAGAERRRRVLSPAERHAVAVHEMGHALTALAMPAADAVHKVSIVPHGMGALGYTLQRPSEDRWLLSRGDLEQRLAVLLGGRAAESLLLGDVSTGAADDIAKATDIARDMVTRYGMDETLGAVSYAAPIPRFIDAGVASAWRGEGNSPQTAQRIDAAVQRIVGDALDRATSILRRYRHSLESCAATLVERETLTGEEIAALAGDLRAAHLQPPPAPACTATTPNGPLDVAQRANAASRHDDLQCSRQGSST